MEKEMATHSSVLAWRVPGMEEPGGLPSVGSRGVRHDWSDLAAAAAAAWTQVICWFDAFLFVFLLYKNQAIKKKTKTKTKTKQYQINDKNGRMKGDSTLLDFFFSPSTRQEKMMVKELLT